MIRRSIKTQEDVNQQRRAAIITRLVDLGYDPDDFSDCHWYVSHPLVKKKQALSDRGMWLLRPHIRSVVGSMTRCQSGRI